MKQRILTDNQVARMEKSLEQVTATIHYCSAIADSGDYIPLGSVMVHRKNLQEIPYRECSVYFEVFYRGKFRHAPKSSFTIHN